MRGWIVGCAWRRNVGNWLSCLHSRSFRRLLSFQFTGQSAEWKSDKHRENLEVILNCDAKGVNGEITFGCRRIQDYACEGIWRRFQFVCRWRVWRNLCKYFFSICCVTDYCANSWNSQNIFVSMTWPIFSFTCLPIISNLDRRFVSVHSSCEVKLESETRNWVSD